MRGSKKARWLAAAMIALLAGAAQAQKAPAGRASSATKDNRPNIILILADDLGYGDLGAYGQRRIATPNLDRLAAEGMRFTDFYAGAPVCAPSRAVLMTGQHTGHGAVRGNASNAVQQLRPTDVTVAGVLRGSGYATGLFGKWGLGDAETASQPGDKGFTDFYGFLNQSHAHNHYPAYLWDGRRTAPLPNVVVSQGLSGSGFPVGATRPADRKVYADDLFRDRALQFITARRDHPFFLFLSAIEPHANNEAGIVGAHGMEIASYGRYARKPWPDTAKGYAAMVTHLDDTVGKVMRRVKQLGIADRTIILFASDNGPHAEGGNDPKYLQSAGPLRGIKRDVYEGGIRSPFIAWWPGRIKAGRLSAHIGYFGDLLPTAADLAGVRTDPKDGISLAPLLEGRDGAQAEHEALYWEFYERGGWQAVRTGRWKAVRQPMLTGPIQLYDLAADIGETRDVAGRHPDIVAKVRAIMVREHVDDPHWRPIGKPDE